MTAQFSEQLLYDDETLVMCVNPLGTYCTNMTAQFSEQLLYDDEMLAMCANPLGTYFRFGGKDPHFKATSSACWRGYIGTWKIEADRLYLV